MSENTYSSFDAGSCDTGSWWRMKSHLSPHDWQKCTPAVSAGALLLGLSVYTTLQWPARQDWFYQHWQRLCHHGRFMGFLPSNLESSSASENVF